MNMTTLDADTDTTSTTNFAAEVSAGLVAELPPRLLKAMAGVRVGYGSEQIYFEMPVCEPEILTAEFESKLQQDGEDQFQLLDAGVLLYQQLPELVARGELTQEAANVVRGFAESSFVGSEPGELLIQIMRQQSAQLARTGVGGITWMRLDEIGHTGRYSEAQLAEAGIPGVGIFTKLAEGSAIVGSEPGDTMLDNFLQMLIARAQSVREITADSPPRLAFHVGTGAESYALMFHELARHVSSCYGVEVSLILGAGADARACRERISAIAVAHGDAEPIRILVEDELLEANLQELEQTGHGIDAIYRLSDFARLHQDESLPILQRAAAGRIALEPNILPFVDNSHVLQTLLAHPETSGFFERQLGAERYRRLREQFPPLMFVEDSAALADIMQRDEKDKDLMILMEQLSADELRETARALAMLRESGHRHSTITLIDEKTVKLTDLTNGEVRNNFLLRRLTGRKLRELSGGKGVGKADRGGEYTAAKLVSLAAMAQLRAFGSTKLPVLALSQYLRFNHEEPVRAVKVSRVEGNANFTSEIFERPRIRRNPFFARLAGGRVKLAALTANYADEKATVVGAGGGFRPYVRK